MERRVKQFAENEKMIKALRLALDDLEFEKGDTSARRKFIVEGLLTLEAKQEEMLRKAPFAE